MLIFYKFKPHLISMNTNKIFLTAWVLILGTYIAYGQTNPIQENAIAKLLFKNVKSKLTTIEKNEIAKLTLFKVNKSKTKILEYAGKYDELELFPIDLNNDGMEEIFIIGRTEESGPSGECWLYIKDETGHYKGGFNEGGQSDSWNSRPLLLTTKTNGWSDLTMSVPGTEMPVLTWSVKGYRITKRIDATDSKLVLKEVADASKEYQKTIK